MRTVFGMPVSEYLRIRNYGTAEENEALDIFECQWAEMMELKESGKPAKILKWDARSRQNDWVYDP